MRLDEIKKRDRNEWVLVEFSKLDKDLRVKDGKVIAHASNKDDIYKALLDTRGKNVAVEYGGDIQEDMVVMFCLDVIRGRASGAFSLPGQQRQVLPVQKSSHYSSTQVPPIRSSR
jgi:hypothetical protein